MSRAQFAYKHTVWGEIIFATKEQLQSFGIGAGLRFPGEPGGSKRVLSVFDPRGYKAKIFKYIDGLHSVHITYPGREYSPPIFSPKLSGSLRFGTTHGPWADEYLGSAEALVGAGLVQRHQLPGQPGGPKVRVTLLPDGAIASRTSDPRADTRDGAKVIVKASKSTYRVVVSISEDEKARRAAASTAHRAEWEHQWLDQPRPEPLHAVTREMHRLAMLPREPHRSESPEAFRDDVGGMARVYLRALLLRCEDAAYRLAPASLALLEQAAEQLQSAIRTALVLPADCGNVEGAETLYNGFWLRSAGAA